MHTIAFLGNAMGHQDNINALTETFNSKKHCNSFIDRMSVLLVKQRISFSEPPFGGRGNLCDSSLARYKARRRLTIGYN